MPRMERRAYYEKKEREVYKMQKEYNELLFKRRGDLYLDPVPLEKPIFLGFSVFASPADEITDESRIEKINRLLEILNPREGFIRDKSMKKGFSVKVANSWSSQFTIIQHDKKTGGRHYFLHGIEEEKYKKLSPEEKSWFYHIYRAYGMRKIYMPIFSRKDLKVSFKKLYRTHFQPIDGRIESKIDILSQKLWDERETRFLDSVDYHGRREVENGPARYLGKKDLVPRGGYSRTSFKQSTTQLINEYVENSS